MSDTNDGLDYLRNASPHTYLQGPAITIALRDLLAIVDDLKGRVFDLESAAAYDGNGERG